MNPEAIHQQITYRLDQLNELHRKMFRHSSSVPQAEIDDFLLQVKQLYEAALLLNHHNSIRSLDEMQLAMNDDIARKPVEPSNPEMADAKVPEISLKTREESAPPAASKNKKGAADLHELFEDHPSLANQFKDKETFADRIASKKTSRGVAEKLQKKPIRDLKEAIGINEKFQFISQLFGGDLITYHTAIEKLNACSNLAAATEYVQTNLLSQFNWDMQNPPADLFMDMIERRFTA